MCSLFFTDHTHPAWATCGKQKQNPIGIEIIPNEPGSEFNELKRSLNCLLPVFPTFFSWKSLNIYCKGRNCTAEAKAAKRALKKAKKEAQRKVMMSPRYLHSWSPSYLPSRSPCHLTSRSPSYLSSRSPSYLACRSPSYLLSRSPSQHRNFSSGQSPAHRGVHASPAR